MSTRYQNSPNCTEMNTLIGIDIEMDTFGIVTQLNARSVSILTDH